VKGQIDNLRSNLIKNALLFLNEFFSVPILNEHQVALTSSFVKAVVPAVLIKTVYEKNFIVNEAKKTLASATKNALVVPDLIEVLVDGLSNKNISIAEYSVNYLGDAIKSVDINFILAGGSTVNILVKQLVIELDGKRMKVKKGAESIFTSLKDKSSVEQI
jgi:hypothetical protein